MKIPFSPPFVDDEVINEVIDSLSSGWITSGPKVEALEEEICNLTGITRSVCVNSWTSGAILVLKWYGIKEGDEVIIPAYTYSATALAVIHCGAKPVMIDITDDFTINTALIEQAITDKTKVIMPVDIAGWPADYTGIIDIVNKDSVKNLFTPTSSKQIALGRILVLSDAAHSIGAYYNGLPACHLADITIFSFHAVKNITTAEGGAICLNLPDSFDNEAEYKLMKLYTLNGQNKDAFSKTQGGGWKYDILFAGLKINMPDLCAAVGLAQIRKYASDLLPLRKKIANYYQSFFCQYPFFELPPLLTSNRESSYHLYALRIVNISEDQRDQIIDEITNLGVAVNVHFIPMPMLTLFKDLGYKIEDFPASYDNYSREISLPIYPQLTNEQLDYICQAVVSSYHKVVKA
jgi:dTDP-4-amino-4,6-dideoxygalactose transaminase